MPQLVHHVLLHPRERVRSHPPNNNIPRPLEPRNLVHTRILHSREPRRLLRNARDQIHKLMALFPVQTPKALGKHQIPHHIKRRPVIPRRHVHLVPARTLSLEPVDQQVHIPLDRVLLLPHRPLAKPSRDRPAQPSMLFPTCRQDIRHVPFALNDLLMVKQACLRVLLPTRQPFAGAVAEDVPPCARVGVADVVWAEADDGAVVLVEVVHGCMTGAGDNAEGVRVRKGAGEEGAWEVAERVQVEIVNGREEEGEDDLKGCYSVCNVER